MERHFQTPMPPTLAVMDAALSQRSECHGFGQDQLEELAHSPAYGGKGAGKMPLAAIADRQSPYGNAGASAGGVGDIP